jgi:uncharacterized protein DUF6786
MPQHNYGQDASFLRKHTALIELSANDGAQVSVAPAYQGRVMTSTTAGEDGASFGWLNRAFIEREREDDPAFNNYGGEDRFWLGPEAGQFALFFAKGDPFDLDHTKCPPGFGVGAFELTAQTPTSVSMTKSFEICNYAGTKFDCEVERILSALPPDDVARLLGAEIPAGVATVAFESVNTLTNAGNAPWTREGGLLSIWSLGMMNAHSDGKVIVPVRTGDDDELGPKATMDYFGPLTPDRGFVGEDHVWFKADGCSRGKIGVGPARATDVFGSVDFAGQTLTIVQFSLPHNATDLPWVNSLWEIQEHPYAGDVINSYNDTGSENGQGSFYELESSSPAAELDPGRSLRHTHRTCHFAGDLDALNALSRQVLGIDLEAVR